MAIDISWLTEAGLDIRSGLSYTGGDIKYISAIRRFFNNYEKNRSGIEKYLAAGDLESYMITVHALKSNAKMIGALELSDGFEKLEAAAREKDTETIDRLTEPVMTQYARLIERLAPAGDMEDIRAADEISAETARQTAAGILEALDDFDDDKAKDLAKKLLGYPFRMTQADRLKEAIGFIEDFMYDEAAKIVREIIPSIE